MEIGQTLELELTLPIKNLVQKNMVHLPPGFC